MKPPHFRFFLLSEFSARRFFRRRRYPFLFSSFLSNSSTAAAFYRTATNFDLGVYLSAQCILTILSLFLFFLYMVLHYQQCKWDRSRHGREQGICCRNERSGIQFRRSRAKLLTFFTLGKKSTINCTV